MVWERPINSVARKNEVGNGLDFSRSHERRVAYTSSSQVVICELPPYVFADPGFNLDEKYDSAK